MSGFVITFGACPFYFSTQGVASPPTSSEADWPTLATHLRGYLEYTGWSWTERVSPIEGSLDCSGLSFVVFDFPVTSGVLSNARPITWLGTRTANNIGFTRLTSTISQLELTSFTVDNPLAISAGSYPKPVYIDQEAISISALDTGTGVATIAPGGRAYYGTEQRPHIVRTNPDHRPVAFLQFPTFYRRKCVLWKVTDAGVATSIWRGYVTSNPSYDGEKTAYKFAAGHLWNLERQRPLGVPAFSTTLRGFNAYGIIPRVSYPGATPSPMWLQMGQLGGFATSTDYVASTFEGACQITTEALRSALAAESPVIEAEVSIVGSRNACSFSFAKVQGSFASPIVTLIVGSRSVTGSTGDGSVTLPRYVTVVLDGAPGALYKPIPYQPVPVSRIDGLPATWTDTPNTTNGVTTSIRYVLRGVFGDNTLVIEPTTTGTTPTGPTVTGNVTVGGPPLRAWQGPREPNEFLNSGGVWIQEAVNLQLNAKVESTHWFLALRYGVIMNTGIVNGGVDGNSWDWSFQSRVIAATSGGPTSRVLYLDGNQNLDDSLGDMCRLHGCGVGLRGSKMSIFPFVVPMAQDTPVLTVTSASLLGPPSWSAMDDGIVNTVRVKGAHTDVVVNDLRSSDLYGHARPIELNLSEINGAATSETPDAIARYAMQRVTGLWSDPASSCTVKTSIANLETVYLGDIVEISEYGAPVGDGTRGLAAARGQVIGRKITIPKTGEGSLELEALLYPHRNLAGYAPCVRVTDITGAVCTVGTAYLTSATSATDYAGSNRTSYRYATTGGGTTYVDGGTSWFAATYEVQLVERDNTSPRAPETFTVSSVNTAPGTRTITLTGSPNAAWQAIIAGGGIVDMIFRKYGNGSVLTAAQELFAFVGDEATEVIDTSSDAVKRYAP